MKTPEKWKELAVAVGILFGMLQGGYAQDGTDWAQALKNVSIKDLGRNRKGEAPADGGVVAAKVLNAGAESSKKGVDILSGLPCAAQAGPSYIIKDIAWDKERSQRENRAYGKVLVADADNKTAVVNEDMAKLEGLAIYGFGGKRNHEALIGNCFNADPAQASGDAKSALNGVIGKVIIYSEAGKAFSEGRYPTLANALNGYHGDFENASAAEVHEAFAPMLKAGPNANWDHFKSYVATNWLADLRELEPAEAPANVETGCKSPEHRLVLESSDMKATVNFCDRGKDAPVFSTHR